MQPSITTGHVAAPRGGWLLPVVLSVTAGAVDVIGFLGLAGLFTAHITGNVVVAAAHFVAGGFSRVGPLLAIPVFVAVVALVTLASGAMSKPGTSSLRPLLWSHAVLLMAFLGVGVGLGPFADAESPIAVICGMIGVAAMATQNALVRLTLKGVPSTTVMTTNITQLSIDLATVAWSRRNPDEVAAARRRACTVLPCLVAFVSGCAAGAALESCFGLWALVIPVFLSALTIVFTPEADASSDHEEAK